MIRVSSPKTSVVIIDQIIYLSYTAKFASETLMISLNGNVISPELQHKWHPKILISVMEVKKLICVRQFRGKINSSNCAAVVRGFPQ